jgi:tetratricopeptide (TPR) repeat protein
MIPLPVLKRWCLGAALLVFAVACARSPRGESGALFGTRASDAEPAAQPRLQWLRYYQAPEAAVRTKRNMLLLYFTKNSCAPCRRMEKGTFADSRVVRSLREFVPVVIAGDGELQVARSFDVRTFPTIVFYKLEEGEIDRKTGFREPDFMVRWIRDVTANRTTIQALDKRLDRNPDDLDALKKQIRNLADADRIDRALELAQRAADVAPSDPDVLALFGLCYFRHGELDKAEAAVTAALGIDARNEEARLIRSAIFLKKADDALDEGDTAMGRDLLASLLESDPDNYDAHVALGRSYAKEDDTERASAEFHTAAELRPSSPVPHALIGDLYQKQGDTVTAEAEFLRAIEMDAKYEPPYFHLIELYDKENRHDEVMEMYRKVLLVEPAGAHNEIAWLLATSANPEFRNPDMAIVHATKAVELEPHPWYIDTLAEAYYAKGEYDLAIAIIKEAIAKSPDNLSYYLEQLTKFEQAKAESAAGDEQEKE